MLWLLRWSGEGALNASLQGGPEHMPWTVSTTLGAAAVNALQGANWQRGGGSGTRPKPILPPAAKRKKSRAARPTSDGARAARRAAIRAAKAPQVDRDGQDEANG